jgi:hypothetical protein
MMSAPGCAGVDRGHTGVRTGTSFRGGGQSDAIGVAVAVPSKTVPTGSDGWGDERNRIVIFEQKGVQEMRSVMAGLTVAVAMLVLCGVVVGAVPRLISYQGTLMDSSGSVLTTRPAENLGIYYNQLVPVPVKAMQEQQGLMELQAEEIQELKARIVRIENR